MKRDPEDSAGGAAAGTAVPPRPTTSVRRRAGRLADRLVRRWRGLSPNLRGSALCFQSFAVFIVLASVLRDVALRVPVLEILAIRQMVTIALIAAICRGAFPQVVATAAPVFQLTRGVIATFAMGIGFYAVANLPLADSNALGFSEVLYTTLGAALVLKETVGWRRWAATGVGLVGVLVMLSPFGSGVTVYTFMAVLAPAFGAATSIMVRMKAGQESTQTLLFWNALVSFVVMAPIAAVLWTTPSAGDAGLIVVISLLGYVAQWSYTRAYQIGEAAALAPMHFTRLLLAAAAGWLIFAEVPNLATLAGAVLVVAATVYTLKRNAVRGVPVDPQGGPTR